MNTPIWTGVDERYWLEAEERILASLVDLAGFGFVLDPWYFKRGWSDDSHIRVRPAVAEALVKAREALPAGHNFKIVDGWRPWKVQERCAADALAQLRAAHPDWPEERIQKRLAEVAPPVRLVPWFDSHRFGGAVDLTIVDSQERDMDMGVPIDYVTGPEGALLWYEFKTDISPAEQTFRDNRRTLIRAMAAGGFSPILAEWWHWGTRQDVGPSP